MCTYLVRPWPLGQCLDALSYHLVKNIGNIIIIRAHSHSAVSNCCEVLDAWKQSCHCSDQPAEKVASNNNYYMHLMYSF